MIARARPVAVLGIILGGAIAIIASTQTWLEVTLRAGAVAPLPVPGASALPLLPPLALAALALGLALAVVGRVLRYAFGAVATAIGAAVFAGSVRVAAEHPLDAVATVVTSSTGLSGASAVSDLVARVDGTFWPVAAAIAGALIAAGGLVVLATAHRWREGGRRYRRDGEREPVRSQPGSQPPLHDAIDSWDDLSHGEDPTAR